MTLGSFTITQNLCKPALGGCYARTTQTAHEEEKADRKNRLGNLSGNDDALLHQCHFQWQYHRENLRKKCPN